MAGIYLYMQVAVEYNICRLINSLAVNQVCAAAACWKDR
jgi:hypothetical protein